MAKTGEEEATERRKREIQRHEEQQMEDGAWAEGLHVHAAVAAFRRCAALSPGSSTQRHTREKHRKGREHTQAMKEDQARGGGAAHRA